jgi:hypothetical protein
MATRLKTITVAELKDLLEDYPDDMPVVFTADYGDRSHTEQALPVKGELDTVTITQTAYSTSGWAVGEPETDDDDQSTYLVIR